MERTKHTPGPWKVGAMQTDGNCRVSHWPILTQSDMLIAWGNPGPEESEAANAHRIAAAPELLAALKELLQAHPYHHALTCAAQTGENDYDPSKCDGCAQGKARAAIAKAEGINPARSAP